MTERQGTLRTSLFGTRWAVNQGLRELRSVCHVKQLTLDVCCDGGWWDHAAYITVKGNEGGLRAVGRWLEKKTGQKVEIPE